jgi:hypothetical protein
MAYVLEVKRQDDMSHWGHDDKTREGGHTVWRRGQVRCS